MAFGYTTDTTTTTGGGPAHHEDTTTSTNGGYTTTGTPECCVMVNTINGSFEIDILHEEGEEDIDIPVIGNIPGVNEIAEVVREAVKERSWVLKGRISAKAEKVCIPCEGDRFEEAGTVWWDNLKCELKDDQGNTRTFGPPKGCAGPEFPPYKIKCENNTWPRSRTPRNPTAPHDPKTNPYVPPPDNQVDYGFSFDCGKTTTEDTTTDGGALNEVHTTPKKPTLCIHQVSIEPCKGPSIGACENPPCDCEPRVIDTSYPDEITMKIRFSGRGPTGHAIFGAVGAGDIYADITSQDCTNKFLDEFEKNLKGKMGSKVSCDCKIGPPRSPRSNNAKKANMLSEFGNVLGGDLEDRLDDLDDVLDDLGWDPFESGPNSDTNTSDDEPCGC